MDDSRQNAVDSTYPQETDSGPSHVSHPDGISQEDHTQREPLRFAMDNCMAKLDLTFQKYQEMLKLKLTSVMIAPFTSEVELAHQSSVGDSCGADDVQIEFPSNNDKVAVQNQLGEQRTMMDTTHDLDLGGTQIEESEETRRDEMATTFEERQQRLAEELEKAEQPEMNPNEASTSEPQKDIPATEMSGALYRSISKIKVIEFPRQPLPRTSSVKRNTSEPVRKKRKAKQCISKRRKPRRNVQPSQQPCIGDVQEELTDYFSMASSVPQQKVTESNPEVGNDSMVACSLATNSIEPRTTGSWNEQKTRRVVSEKICSSRTASNSENLIPLSARPADAELRLRFNDCIQNFQKLLTKARYILATGRPSSLEGWLPLHALPQTSLAAMNFLTEGTPLSEQVRQALRTAIKLASPLVETQEDLQLESDSSLLQLVEKVSELKQLVEKLNQLMYPLA